MPYPVVYDPMNVLVVIEPLKLVEYRRVTLQERDMPSNIT